MSGKYYRNAMVNTKNGVAPPSKYSTKAYGLKGTIDCNGFVADLLNLVGNSMDPYWSGIGVEANGKPERTRKWYTYKKDGKTRYGSFPTSHHGYDRKYSFNPQSRRYTYMSPTEKIQFMQKYGKAGTVMGWTGAGAGGHVWMSTGEFHYQNGKINGLYILESEGYYGYGTTRRWLPLSSSYFERMNVIGRPK